MRSTVSASENAAVGRRRNLKIYLVNLLAIFQNRRFFFLKKSLKRAVPLSSLKCNLVPADFSVFKASSLCLAVSLFFVLFLSRSASGEGLKIGDEAEKTPGNYEEGEILPACRNPVV